MWLGPPSSQMRITEVSLAGRPASLEAALARITPPKPTDAIPATPSCTKFRRLKPSQYRPVEPASMRIMVLLRARIKGGGGRDQNEPSPVPIINEFLYVLYLNT